MVKALIDYLNAPGVVPLQRVVDNFDGDSLNERWTFNDISGTNSGAMADAIDEGYAITTGTGSFDSASIDFNQISHYSQISSIVEAVVFNEATTNNELTVGLSEQSQLDNNYALYHNSSTLTNLALTTKDATTATSTESSIAIDTNQHHPRLELRASSSLLSIDSVLEILKTDRLPTVALQPIFGERSRTTSAQIGHITYLEAYNT